METKKSYSAKEKQAYYMGKGAAMAHGKFSVIKKISDKMPVKERKSFLNGFDDVLIRNARGK